MSEDEIAAFLHDQRTMSVASLNADGQPHLVAMWYGFVDGAPAFWTYAKSQKILNLRRDPRLTVMIEDGEQYNELRGVQLAGNATIIDDPARVLEFGIQVAERYQGPVTEGALPYIQKNAAKRVVVRIDAQRTVSWDHRKLGGVY